MNLRPCPYRQVTDEGRILCDKIKSGDREVSPAICRACPIAQINCAHLRATLANQVHPPLTVRYGNGKTEIWDAPAPPIALERAACSAKVIPILSPRDCAGCPIHQALVSVDSIVPPAHTRGKQRGSPIPATAASVANDEPRKNIIAHKIVQLQKWLAKSKAASLDAEEKSTVRPIFFSAGRGVVPSRDEEKRVGWTD